MTIANAVFLGLIQGLTEFLPISSSGHLVAARIFFNIDDNQGLIIDAFLHLGTLLAVLIYYRKVWLGMIRAVFVADEEGRDKRELVAKIAIATVPGAVAGYSLENIIGTWFRGSTSVAIGLLITAALLLIGDHMSKKAKTIDRATYKDAALIGLAQVIALLPGISRSGTTIAAARMRGLSRRQAATFSFLMSAPIIVGAGLSSLDALFDGGSAVPATVLLGGFLAAFLAGILAINLLIKYIEKISFTPFAVYLVCVALALFFYA